MMELKIHKKDWLFLLACLGLGILAEISFLHGRIGISYPIFILGFYLVLFIRFRLTFNHRRIGLLFMAAIWMLSMNFVLYDNQFFYELNLLLIPFLVLAHIIIITSPNTYVWNTPKFISLMVAKVAHGIYYSAIFFKEAIRKIGKTEQGWRTWRLVLIGIIISLPILAIVLALLMSADLVFQNMVLKIFPVIFELNWLESFFRISYIVFAAVLFFGIIQVLKPKKKQQEVKRSEKKAPEGLSIIAITILTLLNVVLLLFVIIQFTYFFSNQLIPGYTFAEYARRGFFELIFVTLINFSLLIMFLKLVNTKKRPEKITLKALYASLVIISGIMLISAYQRLTLYEEAYGFTLDRLLARSFMIFLFIVFAYTFIRIFLERLSLTHFYLIIGLLYYAVLNIVDLNEMVVEKNLERYKVTEKIDLDYLASQQSAGVLGLIKIYELDPDYPGLKEKLRHLRIDDTENWQAFNIAKHKMKEKWRALSIE